MYDYEISYICHPTYGSVSAGLEFWLFCVTLVCNISIHCQCHLVSIALRLSSPLLHCPTPPYMESCSVELSGTSLGAGCWRKVGAKLAAMFAIFSHTVST